MAITLGPRGEALIDLGPGPIVIDVVCIHPIQQPAMRKSICRVEFPPSTVLEVYLDDVGRGVCILFDKNPAPAEAEVSA